MEPSCACCVADALPDPFNIRTSKHEGGKDSKAWTVTLQLCPDHASTAVWPRGKFATVVEVGLDGVPVSEPPKEVKTKLVQLNVSEEDDSGTMLLKVARRDLPISSRNKGNRFRLEFELSGVTLRTNDVIIKTASTDNPRKRSRMSPSPEGEPGGGGEATPTTPTMAPPPIVALPAPAAAATGIVSQAPVLPVSLPSSAGGNYSDGSASPTLRSASPFSPQARP